MSNTNYDEYIRAAEEQLKNEGNNPTLLLVLSQLHSGITHYKKLAEEYEALLKQAEADMKEMHLGEEECHFCKNKFDEAVCEANDCSCSECEADCMCKLCGAEGERCNFEWRGKV